MTHSICQKSIELLQGITDLLCDIAVLSTALSSLNGPNLSHEENEALCQLNLLSQTAANNLDLRLTSRLEFADDLDANEILLKQESQEIKGLINEVTLMGPLISFLTQRHVMENSEEDTASIEIFYLSSKLDRKITKLQKVFLGLDCQQKYHDESCNFQPSCLVLAYKAKHPEVQYYA